MEEIATEAGLGKASLYYYFSDKDDLFRAVVKEEMDKFEKLVRSLITAEAMATVKAAVYVRERFHFFNRLLNLNILEQTNSGVTKPALAKMYTNFRKRELEYLNKIFKQGKESREFEFTSTARIAEAFLHVLAGLRMRFIRHLATPVIASSQFAKLEREVTLVTEIFVKGIAPRNKRSG